MIEFDRVTKVLSTGRIENPVLVDLSLELPSDKRIVILGTRGSGKTTLLRLLAGITVPTSGQIRRHTRVSFPVGFLGGVSSKQAGHQHVRHAAQLYGADPDEVVAFLTALPGVAQLLGEPINKLPHQSRLALSYALGYAIPFDTYLIDNTIAVGDIAFRQLCEAMFHERSRSSGMILATRNIRFAEQYADVIGILAKGRLALFEDTTEAMALFRQILESETSSEPSIHY